MKKWRSLKTRYKVLYIACSVILAAVLAVLAYICVILWAMFGKHPDGDPIIKVSPDGSKQLVIQEYYALNAEGAIYYIEYTGESNFWKRLTRVKLGDPVLGSYTDPKGKGEYIVEWTDESVTVSFLENGRDKPRYRPETYKLPLWFRGK